MLSFLLETAIDILFEVAIGLFPSRITKLEEWQQSDSPLLRVIGALIVVGVVALVAFLIFWFFIRS